MTGNERLLFSKMNDGKMIFYSDHIYYLYRSKELQWIPYLLYSSIIKIVKINEKETVQSIIRPQGDRTTYSKGITGNEDEMMPTDEDDDTIGDEINMKRINRLIGETRKMQNTNKRNRTTTDKDRFNADKSAEATEEDIADVDNEEVENKDDIDCINDKAPQRGRRKNRIYSFHRDSPFFMTHRQQIRSKLKFPMLVGGNVPDISITLQRKLSLLGHERFSRIEHNHLFTTAEIKALDRVAEYWLPLLVPWSMPDDSNNMHGMGPNLDLTFENLCDWVDEASGSTLYAERYMVQYLKNSLHCFRILHEKKLLMNDYRTRIILIMV